MLNGEELENRIPFIWDTYDQPAMVEDFIDGREFHVSVWGNEKLTVLPVAEMDFSFFKNIKDRLCTYDSKFIPGSDHYEKIETLLPAPLTPEELQALEKVCCDAYRALGCRDYARMDIRLRDNVFYVLDVNPNADISHEASMACAAEVAGISYGQMGSLFVRLAARRHPVLGKMNVQDSERKKAAVKRPRIKRTLLRESASVNLIQSGVLTLPVLDWAPTVKTSPVLIATTYVCGFEFVERPSTIFWRTWIDKKMTGP